jgi:hypothetical protein
VFCMWTIGPSKPLGICVWSSRQFEVSGSVIVVTVMTFCSRDIELQFHSNGAAHGGCGRGSPFVTRSAPERPNHATQPLTFFDEPKSFDRSVAGVIWHFAQAEFGIQRLAMRCTLSGISCLQHADRSIARGVQKFNQVIQCPCSRVLLCVRSTVRPIPTPKWKFSQLRIPGL